MPAVRQPQFGSTNGGERFVSLHRRAPLGFIAFIGPQLRQQLFRVEVLPRLSSLDQFRHRLVHNQAKLGWCSQRAAAFGLPT